MGRAIPRVRRSSKSEDGTEHQRRRPYPTEDRRAEGGCPLEINNLQLNEKTNVKNRLTLTVKIKRKTVTLIRLKIKRKTEV